MLSQLVYVSTRNANCTDQEIDKILENCKKNNPKIDITGVLLFSSTRFIQYVEGESKQILALYDKIKLDKRHEKVMMISYGPISKKLFPSWHMGSKSIKENEIGFRTDISENDKKVFEKILGGASEEGGKVQSLLQKFF